MNVQEAAQKCAANFAEHTGQTQAAIDPTTIITFVNLLIPIIQDIVKCIEAKRAKAAAASPTVRQKVALRLLVRREIGRPAFRAEGESYCHAILKTANDSSEEDVEAVFNDVNLNH